MKSKEAALTTVAFICSFVVTGCMAPIREKASDEWRDAMDKEQYTPFIPPRAGIELGNIITFDDQGREFVVARASTCLSDVPMPKEPTRVFFLDSSSNVIDGAGISGSISEMLRSKVDVEILAKATNTTTIVMKLGEPGVSQFELLTLKAAISKIDRKSDCYKSLFNPKNLVVISNLSIKAATYEFKDSGERSLKLTADILEKAKLTPELQREFNDQASLTIDRITSIGYRALAIRELPGLNADMFEFTPLVPTQVEKYRLAARK